MSGLKGLKLTLGWLVDFAFQLAILATDKQKTLVNWFEIKP